jgi:glycosyltransferase involved in cell wall biosynthesis
MAHLRISIILPFATKTGGILVALEYAQRLSEMGHLVRTYHPVVPYFGFFKTTPLWKRSASFFKALVHNALRGHRTLAWYLGKAETTRIPWVSGRFIADADVVIATAWPTSYSVSRLRPGKGEKAYLIQGYETWSGDPAVVEASYRLPLNLLTIAPRLTSLMQERFGRTVVAEVHNGVDLNEFYPVAIRTTRPLTVLMMHHDVPVKGIPDGLAVLKRLHDSHPDVRFRLFGMSAFPEAESWMEHVLNPTRDRLRNLYQEADVFLSPSLAEGWHLPPMEAMACGCAVVATRVGCIPVLERDGNLMSVEPGDRDGMFACVDALLRDETLRRETARRGLETIRTYAWDAKAREFEAAIARIARGETTLP